MKTRLLHQMIRPAMGILAIGAVLTAVPATAAAAPDATSAAQSRDQQEQKHSGPLRPPTGTHHLEWLGGALHGNPGLHYGEHYNQYTMHIPQHSNQSKDTADSAPLKMEPGGDFFSGAHYDIYRMRMAPDPPASKAESSAEKTDQRDRPK